MDIKRVVVFGDSLLDAGNIIKTLGVPQEPYYKGRFSNGIVSSEYLANYIAKHQEICEIEHKSYAIGGALTRGHNPSSVLKNHSFSVFNQVTRFENSDGRFKPDDLVIIDGGANNFMFMVYNEIPYINLFPKFRVARDLKFILRKVIKIGAQNIIIWNIPDITKAPAYGEYLTSRVGKIFRSYLQRIIRLQNNLLKNRVEDLRLLFPDISLKLFDFHSFLDDSYERYFKYGFDNVTDACIDSYGGADSLGNIQYDIEILGEPNKYLYWDHCHPTTRGHELIAKEMFQLWKNRI